MQMFREFWCWFKVTKPTESPPQLAAIAIPFLEESAGSLYPRVGPKKPPRHAGRALDGWWMPDDLFTGAQADGSTIETMPIAGDRASALTWIASAAGRSWLTDARRIWLMSFGLGPQPGSVQPALAPAVAPAVAHRGQAAQAVACPFPPDAWRPPFNTYAGRPPLLPANWRSLVIIDAPPAEPECEDLLTKKEQDRTPARRIEIIREAQDEWSPILALTSAVFNIDSLELPDLRLATMVLLRTMLDNVVPGTFMLKVEFNRGRPMHCCQGIDPMFALPSRLHPAHPAYPSGHAAVAHAAALLLADLVPGQAVALEQAADRVALNREVAGVHYPSDSAAGKSLAGQLITLLKAVPAFQQLIDDARSEWP